MAGNDNRGGDGASATTNDLLTPHTVVTIGASGSAPTGITGGAAGSAEFRCDGHSREPHTVFAASL